MFACESIPVTLDVHTRLASSKVRVYFSAKKLTFAQDVTYHILALTEAGTVNIWSSTGIEKAKQKQENKFIKPNSVVQGPDKNSIYHV